MTWTFWVALAFAVVGLMSVIYLLVVLWQDAQQQRRERAIKQQLAARYRSDAELFKVVKGVSGPPPREMPLGSTFKYIDRIGTDGPPEGSSRLRAGMQSRGNGR